ncbi:FecA Outer membrane receptor for Fe3+-dicitrate [Methylophilaceae bacterium]
MIIIYNCIHQFNTNAKRLIMKNPSVHLNLKKLAIAVHAVFLVNCSVLADEINLPRINVIGNDEQAISKQPGSVAVIEKEALALKQPLSTQDALKAVPGIVIREEEGYGFIPNIGMRGLNPNRSQKLLVLEDGVPVAPGLFLANESYYSPRIERMQSIEVLKGAAGLRYGPTTIGGVINYKTKDPQEGVKITAKTGSHGYGLLGIDAGGISDSADTIAGISVITSRGDGFRHNGFDMNDIVLKGGRQLNDNQWLSAKFTHYDNEVNTSYVGLRKYEYRNNPDKNPAPNDYFITDRESFDINHEWHISSAIKLNTLMYWTQLSRDFWRRDVDLPLNADGTTFKSCNGTVNCMTGRNRDFEMLGVDSRLFIEHSSFGLKNETEIGVRLHSDHMNNLTVRSVDYNVRTGYTSDNVTEKAIGLALYLQNRFELTKHLALTPGLRMEKYQQKRAIYEQGNEPKNINGTAKNTEFMPGLGATWQVMPQAQVFAGAFKGFSPAMTTTAIRDNGVDQQLDAERSINYELGLRGAMQKLKYEATAFHMDFDNQIINQSLSGGVDRANGGKTLNQGLEFALAYDIGSGWQIDGNGTYVATAEFKNAALGPKGNRLPYAPELTANLNIGYKVGELKLNLGAYHISSQYADAANTVIETDDGTKGKIAAYTVFNLSANYTFDKHLSLFASVRNLANKNYIASRNPDGIFPGVERNLEIGGSYKF